MKEMEEAGEPTTVDITEHRPPTWDHHGSYAALCRGEKRMVRNKIKTQSSNMGSPRQLCCPLSGRETHGKEQNKNIDLQHGITTATMLPSVGARNSW